MYTNQSIMDCCAVSIGQQQQAPLPPPASSSHPISFCRPKLNMGMINNHNGAGNSSSSMNDNRFVAASPNSGESLNGIFSYMRTMPNGTGSGATTPGTDASQSHPKVYKRIAGQRVFVNRNVELGKIKFFGFDMDYTLAEYKSPQYETLGFRLILERLVKIGYPTDLLHFPYDHTFPVRGLWFDTLYGNLLKVDAYGNVLVAVHGQKFLKQSEVEELYPNKFIQLSDDRIYVLNTLFNLPETVVLSTLIAYLDNAKDSKREKTGVRLGDMFMSYKSIFKDVRGAVDWVHVTGDIKRITVAQIEDYVHKDPRLPTLLTNMRSAGRRTFLLTNSDYDYTNKVMIYLLGTAWRTFFDYIIVDARKPLWFAEGTVFRQVNEATGALKIGMHTGPLRPSHVYSGGSCQVFSELLGIRGKEVMYVGDHIFGDVLRSKKGRGWRTFLIVPELVHELRVWIERRDLFSQLEALNKELAELFRNLDIGSAERPTELVSELRKRSQEVVHKMDQSYGMTGSIFRCGSRQTFFASQVERYADLYAGSCCNLIYYPLFYFFRAEPMLMPHESTVDRERAGLAGLESQAFLPRNRPPSECAVDAVQSPSAAGEESKPQPQLQPPTPPVKLSASPASTLGRVSTPRQSTFVHEEGSDEESPDRSKPTSSEEDAASDEFTKPTTKSISCTGNNSNRQRAESENEKESIANVSEYDDVVVVQKPVVETLPKQEN